MINVVIDDYRVIIAFWLIFSRVLPIIMQLPLFDNVSIPMIVTILATLVISYGFFPIVASEVYRDIDYMGVNNFWILTIYNVLVGLVIGYMVKVIMQVFVAAGGVMTQQLGFSAVRYFDQSAGVAVGPYEELIHWTMLVMIISTGALLPMFKGMLGSFCSVHIFDWGNLRTLIPFFSKFFSATFVSALMLASPIIVVNLIIMGVLGIIARTVPQMNVLMVSFVVNIGLGFLIFISISGEFFNVGYKMYLDYLADWFHMLST